MNDPRYDVPCNGCTLCCKHDLVRILPFEDPDQWVTVPHPYREGERALSHQPNGDCIYLGDAGCTIHDTKPQICREMDCRNIARAITWTQMRKANAKGVLNMAVWRRGKDLSKSDKSPTS